MHILITGGTGFIGAQLTKYFIALGYRVTILSRNAYGADYPSKFVTFITTLDNVVSAYDVIINLAGEPLTKNRWNKKVKNNIYESRIQMTQKIIHYIKNTKISPKLLISASAVGFYGSSLDETFKEDSEPADNRFTHTLCDHWEKLALEATEYGIRVCLIRIGIVLGKNGGALKQMLGPFKCGLGAQLGNGLQWMSWIHLDDVIMAIEYLIAHPHLKGVFNLTAPEPVSNKLFTLELAKTLKRPSFLILPYVLAKIFFGEMAEFLLLKGQKVIPERLLKVGYTFKFPKLRNALKDIVMP